MLSVWIEDYGVNEGEEQIAEPVVFRKATRQDMLRTDATPQMQLSLQAAQTLFDELYELGFRSKEGVMTCS